MVAARTIAMGAGGVSRGGLVFHNTGSGKTTVALAIMVSALEAGLRNPALARDIVLTTSPNNLKDNNLSGVYAANLLKFFPSKVGMVLEAGRVTPPPPAAPAAATLAAVGEALSRKVKLQSFVKLAGGLGARGNMRLKDRDMLWRGAGSVVIMDEAQEISTPGAGSNAEFARACRELNRILTDLPPDKQRKVHVWALTASPGDTIPKFLDLLNLVRAVGQPKFSWREGSAQANASIFDAMRGLVFYADIRGDPSRHAKLTRLERPCEMSRDYYKCVLGVLAADARAGTAPNPADPLKYMRRLRECSGFLAWTNWAGPLGVKTAAEGKRRYGDAVVDLGDGSHPRLVSPKLLECAKALVQSEGKAYCYVSFGSRLNGATWVMMALLRRYGYVDATLAASKLKAGATFPAGKRFVVFGAPSMRGTDDELDAVRAAFNHVDNRFGGSIKIALGTGGAYQGLNLAALRTVSILEPLPSFIADLQAEGRGVRYCSHSQLPESQWKVDVVRWLSTAPAGVKCAADLLEGPRGRGGGEKGFEKALHLLQGHGSRSPDVLAHMQLTIPEVQQYRAFEQNVKSVAVDCRLLRSYHNGVECGRLQRVPTLAELAAVRRRSPTAISTGTGTGNGSNRTSPKSNGNGNSPKPNGNGNGPRPNSRVNGNGNGNRISPKSNGKGNGNGNRISPNSTNVNGNGNGSPAARTPARANSNGGFARSPPAGRPPPGPGQRWWQGWRGWGKGMEFGTRFPSSRRGGGGALEFGTRFPARSGSRTADHPLEFGTRFRARGA